MSPERNLLRQYLKLLMEYNKELEAIKSPVERNKIIKSISQIQTVINELVEIWQENESNSNILKGGKGDSLDIDDVDQNELRMGMEVESEHTDDKYIALEIVLDHLAEFPDYYTRLNKMEDEAKRKLKPNPKKMIESDKKMKRLIYLNDMFIKYHHVYKSNKENSERINSWIREYNQIKQDCPVVFQKYCNLLGYDISHDAYDSFA